MQNYNQIKYITNNKIVNVKKFVKYNYTFLYFNIHLKFINYLIFSFESLFF